MTVAGRLSTALLCCLALVAAPAAARAADAFSTPPDPLPAGLPGDVIRAQPLIPRAFGFRLSTAARAWRILYRSTNATGRPMAVTGTIVLPRGTPRALVGLAPGSQGMADACAPSRQLRMGSLYEGASLSLLLERGWAVAIPDYEGLGTPGVHTYMVGRSAGPATLDVVRAALRLPAAGLSASLPRALTGYSQGANAAAWAAQLQPSYAPQLTLAGVAAGGLPSDLAAIQRQVDGGPYAGVMLLGGLGLEAAYGVPIDRYHTPRGTREYREATRHCLAETLVRNAFRKVANVTTSDPLLDPLVRARIEENTLGGIVPPMPVLLQHGRYDDVVPLAQARAVHLAWCKAGARSTWRTVAGDHLGSFAITLRRAVTWLAARIDGTPDPGDCG